MGYKKCSKCKKLKPKTNFAKDDQKKDGLRSSCKECDKFFRVKNKEQIKEQNKKNYEKDKEKRIKYQKEYYIKNKNKIKEYSSVYYKKLVSTPEGYKKDWSIKTLSSHKMRGFIIKISANDLYEKVLKIDYCELCNKKLSWYRTGKIQHNSPTLDRLNNENIINKYNIQILCHECNSTKRKKTIPELLEWCKKVIEVYGKA